MPRAAGMSFGKVSIPDATSSRCVLRQGQHTGCHEQQLCPSARSAYRMPRAAGVSFGKGQHTGCHEQQVCPSARSANVNYVLSFFIRLSIYSDLFFLVFKIFAASCDILTLIACVRPVAGRPVANSLPAFMLLLLLSVIFSPALYVTGPE